MKIWINVAKGLAIWLVVSTHAIADFRRLSGFSMDGRAAEVLNFYIVALGPLRMPLFFAISGALAFNALQRPWGVIARTRLWFFYYLFVIWSIIKVAGGNLINGHSIDYFRILRAITIAPELPWYLLALALYFPAAKLLKGHPVLGVSLGVALSLLVFNTPVLDSYGMMRSVVANFVFFYAGYLAADYIKTAEYRLRPFHAVLALPLAVNTYFLTGHPKDYGYAVALIGASFAAIVLGIWVSIHINAHFSRTARLLAFIGRNTLPIYVIHILVVRATYKVFAEYIDAETWHWFPVPFVVAILAMVVSLGIYALTKRALWWLWQAPGAKSRVDSPANRPVSATQ